MVDAYPLIALAIRTSAGLITLGIAAASLRNSVKDVIDLASQLPARSSREDNSAARDANRVKEARELAWLLVARACPGFFLALVGIVVLWRGIPYRLLVRRIAGVRRLQVRLLELIGSFAASLRDT